MISKYLGILIARTLSRTAPAKGGTGARADSERAVLPNPEHLRSRQEIYGWITQCIPRFKEWYQPVDFGSGVIAHQTCPPDWAPRPEFLHDIGGGLAKWNFIVKSHLPDVSGKRVLDLGCSSGLFSIELARLGAREVIGIDRDTTIRHKSSAMPPPQDVVAQASFVKRAFELLDGTTYPITYIAHDIGRIGELRLGRFDLVIALCVVYHELENMLNVLKELATMTDHLVLQANEAHGGVLGTYSAANAHVEMLCKAGFTRIEIDAPAGYMLPIVVARK